MANIKRWLSLVSAALIIGLIFAVLLALIAFAWGYDDPYGVIVAGVYGMATMEAIHVFCCSHTQKPTGGK